MIVEWTWNPFTFTSTKNVNGDKYEMGTFGVDHDADCELDHEHNLPHDANIGHFDSKCTSIEILW